MRPRTKPTVDPERMCQHLKGDKICGRPAIRGKNLCTNHDPEARQKRAKTYQGRAWAIRHGQMARSVKPITSLDDLIDDLFIRYSQMSSYLDWLAANDEVDIDHFANLTNVHTSNAVTIARLIKEKFDLDHLDAGSILDDALDQLSEEMELEL